MIKVLYSKCQLEQAIDFISKNNRSLLNRNPTYIKNTIMNCMRSLATEPYSLYTGTMGFYLIANKEYESMDADESYCMIDIFVNPSLGQDADDSDIEEIIFNY